MVRVLMLSVGVALVIAASLVALRVRAAVGQASVADGTVVRLNAGGSHPQIEFTASSGQRVSYPQGGLIWGYRTGQHVRVLYDPQHPAYSARIDALGTVWFVPVLLAFIGIVFLAVGVSAARPAPRSTQPTSQRSDQRG
jgi:hypothetical protein